MELLADPFHSSRLFPQLFADLLALQQPRPQLLNLRDVFLHHGGDVVVRTTATGLATRTGADLTAIKQYFMGGIKTSTEISEKLQLD